ncbi:uncharacterized protein LOC111636500 [Centruroides sculpturatus]|uniref:uncharacterized protein LOC111636500 n=1 Tax=Centruroides sculpturatus TaxID=218467 RepID=UPI000C6CA033|nr:uncharacterized protein LOC111636500 [Centruroides sculpturatus]
MRFSAVAFLLIRMAKEARSRGSRPQETSGQDTETHLVPLGTYVNNYEEAGSEKRFVADLENLDRGIQRYVTYVVVGAVLVSALIFLLLIPLGRCCFLCVRHPRRNLYYFLDCCCFCRRPSYRGAKALARREGIKIPEYNEYRRLLADYPPDSLGGILKLFRKKLDARRHGRKKGSSKRQCLPSPNKSLPN